jgi:hypothetical protein
MCKSGEISSILMPIIFGIILLALLISFESQIDGSSISKKTTKKNEKSDYFKIKQHFYKKYGAFDK